MAGRNPQDTLQVLFYSIDHLREQFDALQEIASPETADVAPAQKALLQARIVLVKEVDAMAERSKRE